MTKLILFLSLLSLPAFASSPFIVSNLIDNGLSASQAVVTDASKQLSSVARGDLTDPGTDGIIVTNGASSVFGSGTSFAQHVADATHNGYLLSTDWSTFNGKQPAGSYVTSLTVASANGLAGSFSASTTPVLTLSTSVSGSVCANGTAFSACTTTGSGSTVLATAPTMSNPVVGTQATSDNSTKAASTAFVQTALAQLNPAAAVTAASTANIAGTYTNAVAGVCIADTFQVTSTAAFAPDGVTLTVGQRFLMKDQSSSFQDGVWTLTTAANVGVLGALLTRALDFDSSADLNAGSIVPVISGTVNAGSSWFQTANVTTCNSDSQTWTQFQKASSAYASSTLTNAHIYVGNGSNLAADVAASGDVTLANTGAFTIANLAVTNAKIANSTIDLTTKVTGILPVANATAATQALTTCTTARTVDWSTGNSFTLTLTSGNACTLTFSNPASGQTITLWLTNGSAGGTATVVWPTAKWFPAGAPVMSTGTSALDVCTCTYNGTSYACNCLQNGG